MHLYKILLFAFLAMLSMRDATAQTVRFETSLGNFDIELFPDKAPLNVANFLQYVNSGRYDNTVINRAPDDFVVQMGVFSSPTLTPPPSGDDFVDIVKFPPVQGEPAATTGLSNTRGMVALAISALNINSGTSSFYINSVDNSQYLDSLFSVFGRVLDMTTVDSISDAPEINMDPSGNSLALINIPLQPNGDLIFITDAYVVVPEPGSAFLWGLGLLGFGLRRARRR